MFDHISNPEGLSVVALVLFTTIGISTVETEKLIILSIDLRD